MSTSASTTPPHRLRPIQSRPEEGKRHRLPEGGARLLCPPWRQGDTGDDRQRLLLRLEAFATACRKRGLKHIPPGPSRRRPTTARSQRQGRTLHPDRLARVGLRPGPTHLGSARRRAADLAASLQLASPARRDKVPTPISRLGLLRDQPIEAPQLAAAGAAGFSSTFDCLENLVEPPSRVPVDLWCGWSALNWRLLPSHLIQRPCLFPTMWRCRCCTPLHRVPHCREHIGGYKGGHNMRSLEPTDCNGGQVCACRASSTTAAGCGFIAAKTAGPSGSFASRGPAGDAKWGLARTSVSLKDARALPARGGKWSPVAMIRSRSGPNSPEQLLPADPGLGRTGSVRARRRN